MQACNLTNCSVCETTNCSVHEFYPLAEKVYGDSETLTLDGSRLGHLSRVFMRLGGSGDLNQKIGALFLGALTNGEASLEDLEKEGLPQGALNILRIAAPGPDEDLLCEEKIQSIADSGCQSSIKVALAHTLDHLSRSALAYAAPETSEKYFAAKKTLLSRLPQAEFQKMITGDMH